MHEIPILVYMHGIIPVGKVFANVVNKEIKHHFQQLEAPRANIYLVDVPNQYAR